MNELQRIPLQGIFNTRDLGGILTKDQRRIKPCRLIRSGQLIHMTDDDKNTLSHKYNLKNIIDFRTVNEQRESPDPLIPNVTHISNPILEEMTAGITHDKASEKQLSLGEATVSMKERGIDPSAYMEQMYKDIITSDYSLSQYRRFFDILSQQTTGSTLWHCSAGKDRVGIGTALLLYALGADMDTIMADYLMTENFLKEEIDRIMQQLPHRIKNTSAIECIRICMGVKEDYLLSVFQIMEETAKSPYQFLEEKLALTTEKVNTLKALYLE